MDWSAGDKISDQLRLVRLLVPSRSNRVWLADQLFWHKQVVVKAIPTELPADDEEGRLALADEAARARVLQSPRVAPTLAYGVASDGTPFVLLEPLEGETLSSTLEKHGSLEGRAARDVVNQIAEAVGEAHKEGFIHGALAADNVFVCKGPPMPQVKVLNLGISAVGPRVRNDYVSPEHYLEKAVDARTDIWSLGVIAYELLTCRLPFDQDARMLLRWYFVPPSEYLREKTPEDIDDFFDRVFQVVPDDRFATMEETAQAFAKAVFSPKLPPAMVDGVRISRIGRYHVLDVDDPSKRSGGSDDQGGA